MAKIILIEDNPMLSAKLVQFLQRKPNLEVMFSSAQVQDLLSEKVRMLPPDLILLDINLGGESSLEHIPGIKEHLPLTKIIMITSHLNPDLALEALRKGADSYYIKGSDLNDLLKAIEVTISGGAYLDPTAAPALIRTLRKTPGAEETIPIAASENWKKSGTFVPREIQVIEGLLENLSYKEIAAQNNIGLNTVRHYVKSSYKKLNINSKSELKALFSSKKGF